MARIPIHTLETVPEGSRDGLKALQKEGTFDARVEQAIALVVAAVNGCDYCQAAHTSGAMAAGLTEEETIAIRLGDVNFDPKLGALLTFAREAAQERGRVRGEIWEGALDAGWTETDLLEAHVHIVANVFTNYLNRLVETDVDLPPALPLS